MNDTRKQRRSRLVELDHRHLWHPFTQSAEWFSYDPLVIERAEGPYLVDVDGRRYLDGVSSLWCNVHGHGHPRIVEAIERQLGRLQHSTMLGLSHAPAIELAARLAALAPEPLTRVFFSDSGSTAVEVALRMAFQYQRQRGSPERSRFVTLAEAYHGDTIGSVSLGFSEPFHRGYQELTFRVHKFEPPFLCAPVDGRGPCEGEAFEEAARDSLGRLERLLQARGDTVAAVVMEPLVQGAAGMWTQPPSFVRGVRELCDRFGCLLVCDEVATGFGRTGTMLAVEQAGVAPDILCLAKGLTAGYLPVAATLATERVFEAFYGRYGEYRALFHGHTYGGNPLGCAAALANLEVFEEERTLDGARAAAVTLRELLGRHVAPLRHAGPVRQQGLMVGFDLWKDQDRGLRFDSDERRAHRATLLARERGVFLRPLGDTMVLMPPLTLGDDLLEELVLVTAEAVRQVTEQNAMPGILSGAAAASARTPSARASTAATATPLSRPSTAEDRRPAGAQAAAEASRGRGLFVTGTDTGAGKSLVSAAIVRALERRGIRVGVYKPAETGCRPQNDLDGRLVGEDGELLAAAARQAPPCLGGPAVSSYLLRQPAAPLVAAEAEGLRIEPQRLLEDFTRIAAGSDFVLVEGAGGLMVPIAEDFTYRELAGRLGLPLLCVIGSRLGCVNHALLTLETARAAGLPLLGYVVSDLSGRSDGASGASINRVTIARFASSLPAPDLGLFPFVDETARADLERLAEKAEESLDIDAIAALARRR